MRLLATLLTAVFLMVPPAEARTKKVRAPHLKSVKKHKTPKLKKPRHRPRVG